MCVCVRVCVCVCVCVVKSYRRITETGAMPPKDVFWLVNSYRQDCTELLWVAKLSACFIFVRSTLQFL